MNFQVTFISLLLVSQIGLPLYAQNNNSRLLNADMKGMDLLMISADYLTNSNALNNIENQVIQPSLTPSATMLAWWGADVSVSGDFVANSDDSLKHGSSALNISAGYNFRPHKNWNLYPAITHSFYSRNTNAFRKMFNTDIRADVDYHYKFLNAGATAGYLSGSRHTFYAAIRNSYELTIYDFICRESALVIQPGIDANFGNFEYLNNFYIDQLKMDPEFYGNILRSSRFIRRYVLAELIRHPELTYQQILDDFFRQKAEDSFKLTSVSTYLTALYMVGNLGINVGIYLSFPTNQPDYITENTLIYFTAGLSYCIDF